ncbi:MAG: formylmethanofuran dehydrogenase subunit B, partial [Candidatus Alkanophagales archaeon]
VSPLETLLRTLTERHGCEAYVIPMVGHFNMRGMTQRLFEETSLPNKVKFEGGVARGGASMTDILHEGLADAALIVGSDPLSSLPFVAARRLLEMKTITIDPHVTPTTEISTVRIPCAISGVECGGHAVRMDGVEVTLEKAFDTEFLSDEEILRKLLERL